MTVKNSIDGLGPFFLLSAKGSKVKTTTTPTISGTERANESQQSFVCIWMISKCTQESPHQLCRTR